MALSKRQITALRSGHNLQRRAWRGSSAWRALRNCTSLGHPDPVSGSRQRDGIRKCCLHAAKLRSRWRKPAKLVWPCTQRVVTVVQLVFAAADLGAPMVFAALLRLQEPVRCNGLILKPAAPGH